MSYLYERLVEVHKALRPLLIVDRMEQHNTQKVREALYGLKLITDSVPDSVALLHATAALQLVADKLLLNAPTPQALEENKPVANALHDVAAWLERVRWGSDVA